MSKHGIICIETEWEHTIKKNRLSLHTKPLLEFIEKAYGCPIIYRRCATYAELEFYLKRFDRSEYDDYKIFYLSFHGDKQLIQLEGESADDKCLSLDELSEIKPGVFENRILHFSSCQTMKGREGDLLRFKEKTGARIVSGYTKSVDCVLSAINDIAQCHRVASHTPRRLIASFLGMYSTSLCRSISALAFAAARSTRASANSSSSLLVTSILRLVPFVASMNVKRSVISLTL